MFLVSPMCMTVKASGARPAVHASRARYSGGSASGSLVSGMVPQCMPIDFLELTS